MGFVDARSKALLANVSMLTSGEMVVDVFKGDPKVPVNEVCSDHECANE